MIPRTVQCTGASAGAGLLQRCVPHCVTGQSASQPPSFPSRKDQPTSLSSLHSHIRLPIYTPQEINVQLSLLLNPKFLLAKQPCALALSRWYLTRSRRTNYNLATASSHSFLLLPQFTAIMSIDLSPPELGFKSIYVHSIECSLQY